MAPVAILVILAVVGVTTWLAKPSLFPGASKRATQSTQATAQLEEATKAQGASAAASVAKIGEANAVAPASPSKDFIAREVPVALARLPAPDALALLEAEKRRAAIMEGRLDEARRLYEASAKDGARLQRERDEALAQRREVDLALEQAAAAEHARTTQLIAAVVIAGLILAAYLYAKLHSITPASLGQIAAGIRSGEDPIAAIDRLTPAWLHGKVNLAARIATPTSDQAANK